MNGYGAIADENFDENFLKLLLRRPSNFLREFSSLVRSFNFATCKKFLVGSYCCDKRVFNNWGNVSFRRGYRSVVVVETILVFTKLHDRTIGMMDA